ncbi:Eukaryotic translation initiation factor isoform 4G-2 [Babesia sp. Xinjiang]|uniref:Eukaryotic translation initiation factor isoform 4G-2 n=1 Tax=Babesia sp. Xinjiang TaxID=462227 RepID=UPI000A2513AF|nr:Eukaryotic translation initiation factor isoform 4G-2 [Babesia sp. Xinjiang]ORM40728.1 Eukaryotic translation initiation factor isoform 4G-2 [Babesia sp. Xinjiang]
MTSEQEDNTEEKPKKRTTTLNPDAPEFNPSQTRTSGQLNADAPEFIPGQLGTFDGGIGYVSVQDVKHNRRYKGGYPRQPANMHHSGMQYQSRWQQQYVPMWVPYQPEMERNNAMYDYVPYGYGGRRGYDGQGRQGRVPRHGAPDVEPQKREARLPHGVGAQMPQNAYPRYADEAERRRAMREAGYVPYKRPGMPPAHPGYRQDGGSTGHLPPYHDMNDRTMTWADRFRQNQPQPREPEFPKEPVNAPKATWNGRPTFADMMKMTAVSPSKEAEKTVPDQDGETTMTADNDPAVEKGESIDEAHTHNEHPMKTEPIAEYAPHVKEKKEEVQVKAEKELSTQLDDVAPKHVEAETVGDKKQLVKEVHDTKEAVDTKIESATPVEREALPQETEMPSTQKEEILQAELSVPSVVQSVPITQVAKSCIVTQQQSSSHETQVTPDTKSPVTPQLETPVEVARDDAQDDLRDASSVATETQEDVISEKDKEIISENQVLKSESSELQREILEETPEMGAKEEPMNEVQEEKKQPSSGQSVGFNGIYTIDQLLSCGFEMRKQHIEEKLSWRYADATRDTKTTSDYRRNHTYDDRNSHSRSKGDNWNLQRRTARAETKGFNASYKNLEFSRDQLEAVSLPQASESSWIMKQAKLKSDKKQQLIRKLMGLLNRLTVEKFDTIYKQVLLSGVETYEQAFVLVKIIFEKAITQHHFIPMYVELCAKLSYDLDNFTPTDSQTGSPPNPPVANKQDQKASRKSDFMRILLNCCQDSFESNLKPLEFPPELEGDDRFEYELKYKQRMRGNMIFVGELFKQKLLAAKLLITCLDQVFAKRNECIAAAGRIDAGDHHLEGMCTLLQTVGKCFDTDKWKYSGEFEKHIQMLTDLGRNPNICFRIRCLIQNVLDSRHGNWATSTPYKVEGPCRLQELRTKVMEQEKQQEENAWRTRRRGRNSEIKPSSPRSTSAAPNVLANPIVPPPITTEEIKRRTRGIVRELVMSHDPVEASLCVSELNVQPTQDFELYFHIFGAALEACAKLTADQERRVVAKWLTDLAVGRSSQEALVKWLSGFVKDEPAEHGYSMMVEDYPVTPLMLKELIDCMKEKYANVRGFADVVKIIESEIYPAAGLIA